MLDFSGGPVVKNQPSNAGDMDSLPCQGTKIPHAAGQLSQCAATTEPVRRNSWACALWSPHPRTREKPVRCNERSRMPQLRPNTAEYIF